MSTPDFASIRLGDQVFTSEGTDPVGAVRELRGGAHPSVIIYIENAGDVAIPLTAVHAVHDGKLVIDAARLDPKVRQALGHARDNEVPGW